MGVSMNEMVMANNMNGGMNGTGMNTNMNGEMSDIGMNTNMFNGNGRYWRLGAERKMCMRDNVKCDVNQRTTPLTPTPYNPSTHKYHKSTNTYSHAENSMLKTVNFNLEDIKQWAILDSGATSHFLITDAPIEDERQTLSSIIAKLPDGCQMTTLREGRMRWRDLPEKARWAHKLPELATHSLISVTTLCDAGCTVISRK